MLFCNHFHLFWIISAIVILFWIIFAIDSFSLFYFAIAAFAVWFFDEKCILLMMTSVDMESVISANEEHKISHLELSLFYLSPVDFKQLVLSFDDFMLKRNSLF